jgi:NAD(P)-dependent dehydrogenase (short-subunit alcohol dehydrogenase family)
VTALVTGAARGIGAAIAARLRADGAEVRTLDREPGCDLQVDLATEPVPDQADVDICVVNAAITTTIAPAHRMSDEQWQRDVDVNLTGAYRTIRACLGGMRDRGYGRIVVISSGAARSGLPGQVAYAATKAGLLGLVRTVAAENAGRGITANAILPGMIATEMVKSMPDEIREPLLESMPTGRFGTPEEVAALVAFLASEAAGYVTGEAIGIDGGTSLHTQALTRPRGRS